MEKPASSYNRQKINPRESKEWFQTQNSKLMKSAFFSLCLLIMFMGIILLNCTGGDSSPDPANNTDQTNDNLSSGSATGG